MKRADNVCRAARFAIGQRLATNVYLDRVVYLAAAHRTRCHWFNSVQMPSAIHSDFFAELTEGDFALGPVLRIKTKEKIPLVHFERLFCMTVDKAKHGCEMNRGVPATNKQWAPGAPFAVANEIRVLSSDSTCSCDWGGTIDVLDPACDTEIAE